MIGKERAELVRPVRQDQENVWDEAGLLLDGKQPFADVRRHVREGGNGEAADRDRDRGVHGSPPAVGGNVLQGGLLSVCTLRSWPDKETTPRKGQQSEWS